MALSDSEVLALIDQGFTDAEIQQADAEDTREKNSQNTNRAPARSVDQELAQLEEDQGFFGNLKAFGTSALDSLTFGNAAEVQAGVAELGERLGLTEEQDFADRVAANEQRIIDVNTANPTTGFVGDVIGGVAPTLATGLLGAIPKIGGQAGARVAATAATRAAPTLANTVARSAGVGAVGGLVSDDGVIGEDGDFINAERRLTNAATGGVIGGGLPVVGRGLAATGRFVRNLVSGASGFSGKDEIVDNFLRKSGELTERAGDEVLEADRKGQIVDKLLDDQGVRLQDARNQFSEAISSKEKVDISGFKDDLKALKEQFNPAKAQNKQQALDAESINNQIDSLLKGSQTVTKSRVIQPARPSIGQQEIREEFQEVVQREIPNTVTGPQADSIIKNIQALTQSAKEKSDISGFAARRAEKIANKLRDDVAGKDVVANFRKVKQQEGNLSKVVGRVGDRNLTREARTEKLENFFNRANNNKDKVTTTATLKRLNQITDGLDLEKEALDQNTINAIRNPGNSTIFNSLGPLGAAFADQGSAAFRAVAPTVNRLTPRVNPSTANVTSANLLLNNLLRDDGR